MLRDLIVFNFSSFHQSMCEHNDALATNQNDDDKKTTSMLSMYPPRPSQSTTMNPSRNSFHERPSSDLWLSVMCAVGEGEGELAYAMGDDKKVLHELGDTCDNFDR